MSNLRDLPNISKVNERKLMEAGITSAEELKKLGSKKAFIWFRERSDSGACLSMLCGLEGAVQGVRWHDLDNEVKEDLKAFYHSL